MIVSIKIQNEMNCEYICQKIQEAISRYQQQNNMPDLTDSLLIIDIKKPNEDTELIPKLEFKT
jgi:hypothetical protein